MSPTPTKPPSSNLSEFLKKQKATMRGDNDSDTTSTTADSGGIDVHSQGSGLSFRSASTDKSKVNKEEAKQLIDRCNESIEQAITLKEAMKELSSCMVKSREYYNIDVKVKHHDSDSRLQIIEELQVNISEFQKELENAKSNLEEKLKGLSEKIKIPNVGNDTITNHKGDCEKKIATLKEVMGKVESRLSINEPLINKVKIDGKTSFKASTQDEVQEAIKNKASEKNEGKFDNLTLSPKRPKA